MHCNPGEARKYGGVVARGPYASVHQQFFVALMDMTVDCILGEAPNQVIAIKMWNFTAKDPI